MIQALRITLRRAEKEEEPYYPYQSFLDLHQWDPEASIEHNGGDAKTRLRNHEAIHFALYIVIFSQNLTPNTRLFWVYKWKMMQKDEEKTTLI